jgi:hypothetical protein
MGEVQDDFVCPALKNIVNGVSESHGWFSHGDFTVAIQDPSIPNGAYCNLHTFASRIGCGW